MISNGKNSLDVLLSYMQRNEISCYPSNIPELKGCHFPYHKNAVVIGRFAFQVNCHDTGNSVRAYILTDDKPFEIISATYWKRSGYEHNPDKFETGNWYPFLNDAMVQMEDRVKAHKEAIDNLNKQEQEKQMAQYEADKAKAESYFK